MISDRVAKQKYQINTQLFPGATGIPASFLFNLSTNSSPAGLETIASIHSNCCNGTRPVEIMGYINFDASELGPGMQEMAAGNA